MYVPSFLANKEITLELTSGVPNDYGDLEYKAPFTVKARIQSNGASNQIVYASSSDQSKIEKVDETKAFIFERFQEFDGMLKGKCSYNGNILEVTGIRTKFNPDGSINHIMLEMS